MLHDTQDKHVEGIDIHVSLSTLTQEFVNELYEQVEHAPGHARLHMRVHNPMYRQRIELTAQNHSIRITPQLYKWLTNKVQEQLIRFYIKKKE